MTTPRRLALLLFLATALRGQAFELQASPQFTLEADTVASNQLFLSAETVRLAGTAMDDVFAFARGEVAITGELQRDAWLFGNTVQLSGQTRGHVRVAGQSVNVRGTLARSLAAVASTLVLDTNSVVQEDVALAGENVVLEGRVDGDAQILAKSLTLAGHLGGNVHVIAQDIVVMPGTVIAGDLAYTSPKELFLDRNVQLGGKLIRHAAEARPPPTFQQVAQQVFMRSLQAFAAFLVGLPFLAFFPRLAGRSARFVRHSLWRTFFAGLAGFFALPLVAAFALVTLIGIPLALVVAAMFGVLLYLAKIVVAVAIGGALLNRRGPQRLSIVVAAMAIGLFLLYVLTALPAVGSSLALLVAILGLGALLLGMLRGDGRHAEPPDLPPRPEIPEPPAAA